MGKKMWNNRKIGRRIWGFVSVLWLVMVCLVGCAAPGKDAGDSRMVQMSGEIEESRSQESGSESEDEEYVSDEGDVEESEIKSDKGSDIASGAESGVELGEESSIESDTGLDIKSGMGLDDSWSGDSAIDEKKDETIEKSGTYTSKDEVALYLHVYGRLPDNYITKREAEDLGWSSKEGNLWDVAPGMSIGGSRFGNYEGALPDKKGRKYFECDIDYEGGYRGAKRLIYSDDGLIFYTEDHYNTFEQLYGE